MTTQPSGRMSIHGRADKGKECWTMMCYSDDEVGCSACTGVTGNLARTLQGATQICRRTYLARCLPLTEAREAVLTLPCIVSGSDVTGVGQHPPYRSPGACSLS